MFGFVALIALHVGSLNAQRGRGAPPAGPGGPGRGARPTTGTIERITVHGKALEGSRTPEGNAQGDSTDRAVSVYLPPSYAGDQNRRQKLHTSAVSHASPRSAQDSQLMGNGISRRRQRGQVEPGGDEGANNFGSGTIDIILNDRYVLAERTSVIGVECAVFATLVDLEATSGGGGGGADDDLELE